MTKNSRIKFLIMTAVSIIVIFFAIIVFQLVRIYQYNSRLDKLEKEIAKNKNILAYYQSLQDNESSTDSPDEQIGVE